MTYDPVPDIAVILHEIEHQMRVHNRLTQFRSPMQALRQGLGADFGCMPSERYEMLLRFALAQQHHGRAREAERENAELRRMLDSKGSYQVELCLDRDLQRVMAVLQASARGGDRIRTTDTGREFLADRAEGSDLCWWTELEITSQRKLLT